MEGIDVRITQCIGCYDHGESVAAHRTRTRTCNIRTTVKPLTPCTPEPSDQHQVAVGTSVRTCTCAKGVKEAPHSVWSTVPMKKSEEPAIKAAVPRLGCRRASGGGSKWKSSVRWQSVPRKLQGYTDRHAAVLLTHARRQCLTPQRKIPPWRPWC